MARRKSQYAGDTPTLLTDTVAVPAAPHPAPVAKVTDNPERPAFDSAQGVGDVRRYAHLIAVEDTQLRHMLADTQGDAQVPAALERKSREIDKLRGEIVRAARLSSGYELGRKHSPLEWGMLRRVF